MVNKPLLRPYFWGYIPKKLHLVIQLHLVLTSARGKKKSGVSEIIEEHSTSSVRKKERFEFRLLEIKKAGEILVDPKKTHEEHEINRYFCKILHQHTRVFFSEKINKKTTHKQTQNTKPDQIWARLGVFFFLQKAPFQQKGMGITKEF